MALVLDYLGDSIHQLHEAWDQAISDLTPEQMHFRPNDIGNHIGFIAWHYIRTEDNLVQFAFQQRKPTVWLAGGYDQAFGLPRTSQGTGMPREEAARLQLPAVEQWMGYQRQVWQATDVWLQNLTEDDLLRSLRIMPFGDITVLTAVRIPIINHGFLHLGHIGHLRRLQGLKSSDL